MSKLVLNDLQNLNNKTTAVNTININNGRIEDAIENTLSRDGDGPNEMNASLDMNSFPIYNLPKATSATEPLRKQEFDELEIAQDVTALLEAVEDAETAANVAAAAADDAEAAALLAQQAADEAQSVSSNFQVFATRAAAVAATISATAKYITTKGYATVNDGGGGDHIEAASEPSHAGKFQSADGQWWELIASPCYPKQFGATLDGTTDDTTAIQNWLDYAGTKNVRAHGQNGTAAIPTGVIQIPSTTIVDGLNELTIRRTTDTNQFLVEMSSLTDSALVNTTLSTSAGFGSTTSHTVSISAKAFTVPAGIVGLVVNDFVFIQSVVTPSEYMIARINSYAGTTLTVTSTTAVGSGTFTNWYIDVYPTSGVNPGNCGVTIRNCTRAKFSNNRVTGRFYIGIEERTGTSCEIKDNYITGFVNRGIGPTTYSGSDYNTKIIGNLIDGGGRGTYGINSAAVDGGSQSECEISGNVVRNVFSHGISSGGQTFGTQIRGNQVWMNTGTASGIGILTQTVGGIPQYTMVSDNVVSGGLYGIYVNAANYGAYNGNILVLNGTGIYHGVNSFYNALTGNMINNPTAAGIEVGGGSVVAVTGTVVNTPGTYGIVTNVAAASVTVTGNAALTYSLAASGSSAGNT